MTAKDLQRLVPPGDIVVRAVEKDSHFRAFVVQFSTSMLSTGQTARF
jgi:hypothetical protein